MPLWPCHQGLQWGPALLHTLPCPIWQAVQPACMMTQHAAMGSPLCTQLPTAVQALVVQGGVARKVLKILHGEPEPATNGAHAALHSLPPPWPNSSTWLAGQGSGCLLGGL